MMSKKIIPNDSEAPGTVLSGANISYNAESNNRITKELQVTPITLYSSEYNYHHGSLIAVNNNFICYTVRGT
jgi:hypothetical protein